MREFSDKYLEYLCGPLKGINLTRITDAEEFYNKQIVDSLRPVELSATFTQNMNRAGVVIDVGFGGGFPILPLAHKNPSIKFIGFEARKKKATAVTDIANYLGVTNAQLFHQRLEMVEFDKEAVITFKAVGKISDLLNMISASVNVYVYFYKGPNWEELEDLDAIQKNWTIIETLDVKIPGTEGRTLIGFKNKNVPCGTLIKKGKKDVPRGTKTLVKLSKFI